MYSFQMGKEAGTHFGLFLNLKDELYDEENISEVTNNGYKEFELSFDFKNGKEMEDNPLIQEFLKLFEDDEGRTTIYGYYKLLEEKNHAGERRIKMGISFSYILEKIKESMGLEDDFDFSKFDELSDIEIIQKLLYATHKDNNVNFYLPVSVQDAVYQLYWYGVDIQMYYTDPSDPETFVFNVADVEAHEYGTFPKDEEVTTINETYPTYHNAYNELLGFDPTYRTFYQLKMGLTKN